MSAISTAAVLLALAAALAGPPSALPAARLPPQADAVAEPETVREMFRLRLVNDYGGEISVSRDAGWSWRTSGRVLRYTTRVNRRAFTASKWVPPGRVAATAVNAVHINVGYNAEDDRGVVFSVLPREFLSPPPGYRSFLSPDSSIYTDLGAGEGIFGGDAAPLVGSRVYRECRDGSLSPLGEGYVPARGDVLVIAVARPARYPVAAIFENWEGGGIAFRYADGTERLLGWVIRPVRGIGRFAGSRYACVGRIRASHPGVIDVSTSPAGFLGAFQIIPMGHALSPEMDIAWRLTQWMIAGPAEEESPLWEGAMPLFYQHLRPSYRAADLYAPDWKQRLLARFLVEGDFGGGWRPLPALRLAPDPSVPLPEWAHHALDDAKRLRILFPVAEAAGVGVAGNGGCVGVPARAAD